MTLNSSKLPPSGSAIPKGSKLSLWNCRNRDSASELMPVTEPTRVAFLILVLPRADGHALAQALSKLAKGKGGLPGDEFEEAASSTRVARELIVVSKRSRAGCKKPRNVEGDVELTRYYFLLAHWTSYPKVYISKYFRPREFKGFFPD